MLQREVVHGANSDRCSCLVGHNRHVPSFVLTVLHPFSVLVNLSGPAKLTCLWHHDTDRPALHPNPFLNGKQLPLGVVQYEWFYRSVVLVNDLCYQGKVKGWIFFEPRRTGGIYYVLVNIIVILQSKLVGDILLDGTALYHGLYQGVVLYTPVRHVLHLDWMVWYLYLGARTRSTTACNRVEPLKHLAVSSDVLVYKLLKYIIIS